jgi:hypothetical protein
MRGLAVADWLVSTTSRALGARVSRRGFIAKTTMVGTAVAATGCAVVTQPGPPFQRITDCRGGLCRDGYTEFCCVINNGVNACPAGSIPSGWWRADYSVYCNGTRYYIDCNDFSGYAPCGCAAGCDTRKVYCNHFRYGQCAPWVGGTGVIACRMVTCVPPFLLDIGCGFSGAVDNATAGHNADCAAYAPPAPPPPPPLVFTPVEPSLGGAVSLAAGTVSVFARGSDGAIGQQSYDGSAWAAGWSSLGGSAKSTISAISPAAGEIELAVRADDRSAAVQRFAAGAGTTTWESLGGAFTSDVVAAVRGSVVHVVGRGTDNAIYTRRWDGATWSAWESLGGALTSDPILIPFAGKLSCFARGTDGAVYQNVYGGTWSGWSVLGGGLRWSSSIAAAATPSELHVFVRGTTTIVFTARSSGGSFTPWEGIGGLGLNSDPVAVADGADVSLFGRAGDQSLWHVRRTGSAWGAWESLSFAVKSDPVAVSDGTGLWVFAQGTDDIVQCTRIEAGVWSGSWTPLPGTFTAAPIRGYA